MSELRKPCFVFLLKNEGKKKFQKVELFNCKLWPDGVEYRGLFKTDRYRIRVNGKWMDKRTGGRKYHSKTQIRDLLWKSIYF